MAKTLTKSSAAADETDGLASFKAWWKDDRDARDTWAKEAEKCFAFTAGDQWTEDERSTLEEQSRPCITFNRIAPIVDSVAGLEVNNRHETRYIPREQGDVKPNEILSGAAEWYRDVSSAEEHDSDAFRDCVIGGMGWTDNRLDFEGDDPDGAPFVEKIDPFEMFWDHAARKANMQDARRLWRARKMPRSVAEEMFPDADPDDLDASGWCDPESNSESNGGAARKYRADGYGNDIDDGDADKEVTIVHVQWREMQDRYRVAFIHPETMQKATKDDLSAEDHKTLTERLTTLGVMHKSLKQKRPVYRQAFLGRVVLEQPEMPRNGFTWACITGRWDQKKRVWYGIVRAMLDPQEWANKWLSQALHILNTNAKGGIMAEKDAFEDLEQARQSWAAADRITVLKQGGLAKVAPKPGVPMPQSFMELMQFAISSVRDTAGTSLELLGMADTPQQTGMVEESRKQSSMTVLATLFDSLRRYRKVQAKIILDYLKDPTFVNGRLFRITGGDQEKYQQLRPDILRSDLEYDIIIDESASSPNQKEKTWQQLQLLFPALKDRLSSEMILKLMEYSPLPSSVVDDMKQIAAKEAQAPPPPDPKLVAIQKQWEIDQQRAVLEGQQEAARQKMEDDREVAMAARQAATEKAQRDAEIAAEQAKTASQIDLEREKFQFSKALKIIETRSALALKRFEAVTKAAQSRAVTDEDGESREVGGGPLPAMPDDDAIWRMIGDDPGSDKHGEMMTMMQGLLHVMTSPTEVVRDENGRPVGARRVVQGPPPDLATLMQRLAGPTEFVADANGRPMGARPVQ